MILSMMLCKLIFYSIVKMLNHISSKCLTNLILIIHIISCGMSKCIL